MTQNTLEEELEAYLKRAQSESLARVKDLAHFTRSEASSRTDGFSLSDLGTKITFEQGKQEVLQYLGYLLTQEENRKEKTRLEA